LSRVIDDADHIVAQKRLPNEIAKIVGFLARWQDEMAGVVVELVVTVTVHLTPVT
jgi:hypothetical protein